MSPIAFNTFRTIRTDLQLNGPILNWVQEPADAVEDENGLASFTGIASVSFPDGSPVTGDITYKWFYQNKEILDTSVDSKSDANIETVGTATTLTLSNIDFTDSGSIVYLEANYNPPEWPTDEGNGNNETFQSRGAILVAQPEIVINSQPVNSTIGKNIETVFSIDAGIPTFTVIDLPGFVNPPEPGELKYQWKLDGANLIDGTQNTNATTDGAGKIFVQSTAGENYEIDFTELASFQDFYSHREYTLYVENDMVVRAYLVGGGGGTSRRRGVRGGGGGTTQGEFTMEAGKTYTMIVGGRGLNGGEGGAGGYNGGGQGGGGHGLGGGGGGFTVIYEGTVKSQENAIMIAGGGGGGSNDPATGGHGGGRFGSQDGERGSNGGRAGGGGTGSSGGSGAGGGTSGTALQGGTGAAGGGGGYFGGGGGQYVSGCCADGAGGGGSGYIDTSRVTSGLYEGTDSAGGGSHEADGSFKLDRVTAVVPITATASGTNTPRLTISSSESGFAGKITCELTADNVETSPVTSETANFVSVEARDIIEFEAYTTDNQYKTRQIDLDTINSFSLDSSTFGSDYSIIQFHVPESQIEITCDIYAAAGQNNGTYSGGEGGTSRIKFTPERNVEYTIIGVSNDSGVFLYRGGTLIAAVGAGGDAGSGGDGGAGGGVQNDGETAPNGGGQGGVRARDGIEITGAFGSILEGVDIDLRAGDSIVPTPSGGRTISCTKGSFWVDQGIDPCANNTLSGIDDNDIQFYGINGGLVSQSAPLTRGFKPGYTVTTTGGKGVSQGGNGGSGATGGDGGEGVRGGGGGSGYTTGEVTVMNSTVGGNAGGSRIAFSTGLSGYYIDEVGRILILSSPDNRDPRTLTKTTGIVNPGDAACIDDERWQAFLNLARDGTQNYRLTGTLNNSTVRQTQAQDRNIYRMMNTNVFNLRNSLTDWYDSNYSYLLLTLAWDETSGSMDGFGLDYSILSWSDVYGYGYYGQSSNSFFSQTNYSLYSANWWILPPGVPDFD